MADQILSRLEAATSRLESYANKVGGGEAKTAASLSSYDEFTANFVVKFVDSSKKFSEIAQIAEMTDNAFKASRVVIEATTVCKKPSQNDLIKLIEPISSILANAEKLCDKRHPFFPHQKSFHEAISSLSWMVTPSPPRAVIEGQLQSADFYLNQVLNIGKKQPDQQANHRDYVNNLKGLLNGMMAFVVENFKAGLEWNPKGGDVSSFKPGSTPAASSGSDSAPSAPDAPPDLPADLPPSSAAAAPANDGGRANLFAAINAGGALGSATEAFGLKKVTSDMKSKNMKDRPALEPLQPKAVEKKKPAVEEKTKPSRLELNKGTWFCENYVNEQVTVAEAQMKQSVYIAHCKNATIQITDKCKSIQVDNCHKTNVVFKSVVSTFEIVNSQRCVVQVLENVPAVAVDKTSGFQLILTSASVNPPPDIVCSNVSEINLVVPGATETDDPVEIALPEQFLTKYDLKTKKITTTPVTHGG